jgi:Fe-S-cluster containining protein
MESHYRLLAHTKQQYRDMFAQAALLLESQLLGMRAQYGCVHCEGALVHSLAEAIQPVHARCGFQGWQREALRVLEQEVGLEILNKLQQVEAYKNTFDCHMCGACCRMASTDADYPTLRLRAENGDEFAQQFISVFLPYASRQKALETAPDIVVATLAEAGEEAEGEEQIFFYHCPYVGEDNRCTVYGTDKRPAMCQSYPETPLSFVYEKCAWKPWKNETHGDTLLAHALLALCTDWCDQLKRALQASI